MAQNPGNELEAKKKWVESAFKSGRSNDAENQYKQFSDIWKKVEESLKGTPSYSTWNEYHQDLGARLHLLKSTDEATELKRKAETSLKWIDSCLPKDPIKAKNYLNEVSSQLITLKEKYASTVQIEGLSTLIDSWPEKMQEYQKRIDEATLGNQFQNQKSGLELSIRTLKTKSEFAGIEREGMPTKYLEDFETKKFAEFRKKFENYGPAQDLIQKGEEVIAFSKSEMVRYGEFQIKKEIGALEAKIDTCSKAIRDCYAARKCTFVGTQKSPSPQPQWNCETCGNNFGLCVICVKKCHNDGSQDNKNVQNGYHVL